jgi:FAD-linked oxidoreductase
VDVWTNWAGTATARPTRVAAPRSIAELQHAVALANNEGLRVKAVGSGHSFTPIAVTDGVLLRLDGLTGIVRADTATGLVTVRAGMSLSNLTAQLWQHGLAMSNLGDVDVQTISGAISTGTHGTGLKLGGIATQVRALQLVLADGRLLDCSANEHPDVFAAARIGLGALGVIATVTLHCERAYALHAVEAPSSLDETLDGLDDLVQSNDHFEFYWFPHTRRVLTKCNNRVPPGAPFEPVGRLRAYVEDELLSNRVFGWVNELGTAGPRLIPHINAISARAVSAREYVDRSYAVFASPRRVRFREMEYAVPREAVPYVLAEIDAWLRRSGEHVAFPVEVRFAAADDIWLSTAYARDSGYIAVHQYHRREHERYFRAVEAIAQSVDGRPHWGKLHWRDADSLRGTYPHLADFIAVRDRLDPGRAFANDHLREVIGP